MLHLNNLSHDYLLSTAKVLAYNKTFVVTGTLKKYTRQEIEATIESLGGKSSSSVSKKTSAVIAGENAGSKYDKAQSLGIPIWTEEDFEKYKEEG